MNVINKKLYNYTLHTHKYAEYNEPAEATHIYKHMCNWMQRPVTDWDFILLA